MFDTKKPSFAVANWKAITKNTLRGFFDLHLPTGMIIRECSLQENDRGRWVALPGKAQVEKGELRKDANGKVQYVYIFDFTTKDIKEKFLAQALDAITRHLESQSDAA